MIINSANKEKSDETLVIFSKTKQLFELITIGGAWYGTTIFALTSLDPSPQYFMAVSGETIAKQKAL